MSNLNLLHKQNAVRERNMKSVRVDAKTVIIVDASISNEEAVNDYLLKIEENHRKHESREVYKRWK